MFRFFVRHLSKHATGDITQKETLNQFKELSQNPQFVDIIKKMRLVSERVRDHGHGEKISAEEIAKLLELEKESAKFSIY